MAFLIIICCDSTYSFRIRQYPYKSHVFCVIDILGYNFPLKEGTVRVPLPFSRNWPENHSHNLGKALGEGMGLLCAPFTSLFFSPLYPFHLSLSLLSLPPSLYLSFYLSFSLSPSLCLLSIIFFGVSNGRFRPCY